MIGILHITVMSSASLNDSHYVFHLAFDSTIGMVEVLSHLHCSKS